MKKPRLATPIFLVRHQAERDFFGVVQKLGQLGYSGFEMGGLYGHDPFQIRRAAGEVGLEIVMDHVPYQEFERDLKGVIATRAALGSRYISICKIPQDKYPGGANFKAAIAFIHRVAEEVQRCGMTLQYHNHGFDFMGRIDGKYPIEHILDSVPAQLLQLMPDLGWCALGGGDVSYLLEKYKNRCRVIHLKDYYAQGPARLRTAHELDGKRGGEEYFHFEFRPTGYGIMNYPALLKQIMDCAPEWLTADHDGSYCGKDYEELRMSREYMEHLLELSQIGR